MERFRCLRFFVGVIWFCTVAASILIGCSDSASESETQSTDRDNDEELDLLLSQTPAEGSEGGDVVDSNDRPKVERKVLEINGDFGEQIKVASNVQVSQDRKDFPHMEVIAAAHPHDRDRLAAGAMISYSPGGVASIRGVHFRRWWADLETRFRASRRDGREHSVS